MNEQINGKAYFSLRNRLILTVYIISFLACFFCGVKAVKTIQMNLLDNTYKTALNEQFRIGHAIKKMAESQNYLSEEKEILFSTIRSLAISYSKFYGEDASYRITADEAVTLYSNIPETYLLSIPLDIKTDGTVTYLMDTVSDRILIYVSSYIKIYRHTFRLDFIQDVSGIKETQMTAAAGIGAVIFVLQMIMLGALYLTIGKALKPLNSLGEKAMAIAKGNYSLRAEAVHNDEVGRLALNFNQMAEAVEQHIEQLYEAAKMKAVFAADLAHEIRTPITSIVAYSDYLAKNETDEEFLHEILEHIKKEGLRIGHLSEIILKWTRLNENAPVEKRPCRPQNLIDQALFTLIPYAEQRGQRIKAENDAEVIFGDEALLISLLVNLCKNALDASKDGGIVDLRIHTDQKGIYIKVKDRGKGIEESELQKIVEPFYRIDKARDRSKGGAGLGLSLCRTIVNVHGGSMHIESVLGQGTHVEVFIPQ